MMMMACDFDELEINPFYIALQNKYIDHYEKAQKHCYHLCVPQDGTFIADGISTDFVETHILRPSPYFKGQFMTTHNSKSKTVAMSENGQFFTTLHGFEEEVHIKILSEELAYNKDYQQYRILIVEKPLDPRYQLKGPKLKEQREKQLHTHKFTVRECSEFLKSFPEFKHSLTTLDKNIEYFCSHYMVLPDYLDDAGARLKALSGDVQKEILQHLKPDLSADSKLREVLAGATESYIMNAVYHKVFVVVRQRFSQLDQLLLSKCHKLNKVRPEDIGVRKEFSCPLPKAVVELANVDSLFTPREKLICLKSAVDNVTEGITAFLTEKRLASHSLEDILSVHSDDAHDSCITSDDLIPILVMVIARAKCCHLHSDLFYIENFMWESTDQDRDDLGYCLVSFKAAAQYMTETDFTHLKESDLSSDREASIADAIAVTSLRNEVNSSAQQTSTTDNQKRRERQLSRISDVLEQTAQEMEHQILAMRQEQILSIFPDRVRKFVPEAPQDDQNGQSSQLGDFLSSLQNDVLDQPFGKQK